MARRRSFVGSLVHEMEVAQRNNQRAQAAYARNHAAYVRNQAREQREAERVRIAEAKVNARNALEAEKAAKQAHIEDRETQAAVLNSELNLRLGEIDSLLMAGLKAGGYIDLESLRIVVEHPLFASQHEIPFPSPDPIQASPEPVLQLPEPPKGLGGLFKKSQHAAALAAAEQEHTERHAAWQAEVASIPMRQMEQLTKHAAAEAERQRLFDVDRAIYESQCSERQVVADAANARLDELIADLKAGDSTAVKGYAELVFSKSEYPDGLKPAGTFVFEGQSKELRIDLKFPRPEDLPHVKQYRYLKAHDEITEVAQSSKELRDRYLFLISAITLRTLHEIFDADRDEHVQSVALTGGVAHVHEGVGKEVFTPLLQVALSRESYKEIDLSRVTPSETLKYLGAIVSKNAYALEPVNAKAGIRTI